MMQTICCAYDFPQGDFCPRFSDCKKFKIYLLDDEGEAAGLYLEDTDSLSPAQKIDLLAQYHVQILMCGTLTAQEEAALRQTGIQVYDRLTGRADRAVLALSHGHFQEELQRIQTR